MPPLLIQHSARWRSLGDQLRRPRFAVGIPLIVALIHISIVAPRYHVGSFDDDAAYLVMAHGILHGVGLGGYLAHHVALLDAYPPGYPALLAPLLWLFGDNTYLPERLLSALCMGALFPLTWVWLARQRIPELARFTVLALLALNPYIGTYGSMVMAEAPFLVVLVALLIVGERWQQSGRSWCWSGVATIGLVVAEIWLKEAALAFLPGLVLWLAWRRRWRAAAMAAFAGAAGLVPIVLGRLAAGVPIAGSRYTSELGGYYKGGPLHRLGLIPQGAAEWCLDALPSALVPTGSPLNATTGLFVVFRGLACATTALFVVIGAATWIRRREPDLAVCVVLAYAAEVCLYKYVNDRRALLVLPVLVSWYVGGVAHTFRWAVARLPERTAGAARWKRRFAVWGVVAVAGPLVAQFPVDYRYNLGQSSPAPAGSPYMALLRHLGGSSQVVETTYVWSTALLSGHATDSSAATAAGSGPCDPTRIVHNLRAANASYLLSAAIDIPGQVDSPCLAKVASDAPWAVPLLQTPVDDATVFELVGPQTAQPNLRALLSVPFAAVSSPQTNHGSRTPEQATTSSMTWALPSGAAVRQVSLGRFTAISGTIDAATVLLREGSRWRTVTTVAGPMGAGTGVPFVLATLPAAIAASALRINVAGRGALRVGDLAVLGTITAASPGSG